MKTAQPHALPPGRRWAVRGLVTLATLIAVLSIAAVWANRQVLDANNWADTSTKLLENDDIRGQVSGYVVDQLYANVDVAGQIAAALPPRLDPLAAPAANGLRQLAENRTNRLLDRPRVQEAWKTANRVTAQQFIDIAENKSSAVTVNGNAVILDLRAVMLNVAQRLGGSGKLVSKVPPDAARVTIMKSDQVSALQDAVSLLRGLAAVLPFLAVALFALAVFLARGRRRRVLMNAGFGFIAAGVLVLVLRNVAGGYVVGALATTASVEPAARAAWDIGTNMLRDVAQAAIIMGIPVVLAAWVAGPTRVATSIRRSLAPWLRTRPGATYGVLAAAILLVIAWGPIPATRMVLPVLLMIVLAVAGMEVLRRQVAEEFPTATPGELGPAMRAGLGRAMRSVRHGDGARAPVEHVTDLERLAELHERGVLSDEEFAAEKSHLIDHAPVR